jgi:hypothetical protein
LGVWLGSRFMPGSSKVCRNPFHLFRGQGWCAWLDNDFLVLEAIRGNFARITEPTRWIDYAVKVMIYIDRKLMSTIDLVTR